MSTLLIHGGTLVTAHDTWCADILVENDRIREIAPSIPVTASGPRDRRFRHAGVARRYRRSYTPRYAFRRHDFVRRFRNRYACRGLRRNHHHRRFRHSGARYENARRAGYVVEQGGGQSLHRLRPAHDCDRSWRGRPRRYGRHGARRRGQFQAVHGLSRTC